MPDQLAQLENFSGRPDEFASLLKSAMERSELTSKQLAALANVSEKFVGTALTGGTLTREDEIRLVDGLKKVTAFSSPSEGPDERRPLTRSAARVFGYQGTTLRQEINAIRNLSGANRLPDELETMADIAEIYVGMSRAFFGRREEELKTRVIELEEENRRLRLLLEESGFKRRWNLFLDEASKNAGKTVTDWKLWAALTTLVTVSSLFGGGEVDKDLLDTLEDVMPPSETVEV